MVRFVLKRGPFVHNVVRFVLAMVRFVCGPFCPWSIMSLILRNGLTAEAVSLETVNGFKAKIQYSMVEQGIGPCYVFPCGLLVNRFDRWRLCHKYIFWITYLPHHKPVIMALFDHVQYRVKDKKVSGSK